MADSLPLYDQIQQVYCISAASNAAGTKTGTTADLEAGFKKPLDKVLPRLTPIDTWKTVWGPAVYKLEPNEITAPVNAWFVGQNDKDKILVVGVAGTALKSGLGWLEDCNVNKVVAFDKWTSNWKATNVPVPPPATDKTGTLASFGTCYFVRNILSDQSPSTGAAAGTLLGQFLQNFQTLNPSYMIFFTGHSLGGAVSPSVALGLVQAQILKIGGIRCMPSAGASPGNSKFNEMFTTAFPAENGYNTVVYNTLDIVPQAWCVNSSTDRNIDNILKIYSSLGPILRGSLKYLVEKAITLSNNGTQYVGLPGSAFNGRPIPSGITTLPELLKEGLYQHTGAYWDKIGITDFVTAMDNTLLAQPGVGPEVALEKWELPEKTLPADEV